ncbi:MAG TPA: M48 family metallopeptidase [Bacteroidota bacterium]|nr:M48 family metallopeptidase [Bacteroidota bacterium]
MEHAATFTERQEGTHGAGDPPAQSPLQRESSDATEQTASEARRYAKVKLRLSLVSTALYFVLSLVLLAAGVTRYVEGFVRAYVGNDYAALFGFAAILGLVEMVLSLPLTYYSGFHLEHKYKLSNQTFRGWIWEGTKGLLVSLPIVAPLMMAFYFCLKEFGSLWWLPVGSLLFIVSVILARLAPVLIFPLFYKFQPLQDGALKTKILELAKTTGMSVQGIFVFDMSKNTKKANAAFTGIGKSKRIILGDTLVANFTDEEIESVFAHELGHYKLRHIVIMMALGTISSFLGLYLTAVMYSLSLSWFGFGSVEQIAALPLLMLWLGVYSLVTSPLTNAVSRAHEFAADNFAVRLTRNPDALSNALRKLASINLAELSPPPLVELLFHSHPSIEKRIQAIHLAGVSGSSGSQA